VAVGAADGIAITVNLAVVTTAVAVVARAAVAVDAET
jgi:hypothetical protein